MGECAPDLIIHELTDLSDLDFEANARDGFGVDWPIRYADIAPWYAYVERFAGISGTRDGLPQLPEWRTALAEAFRLHGSAFRPAPSPA